MCFDHVASIIVNADHGGIRPHLTRYSGIGECFSRGQSRGFWKLKLKGKKKGNSMPQKLKEHHTKAAEHHEHAAKHHRKAAEHHGSGKHETAAHHAHAAHGHHLHATHHATEAAKRHVELHGHK
jgi:hypothetical protein